MGVGQYRAKCVVHPLLVRVRICTPRTARSPTLLAVAAGHCKRMQVDPFVGGTVLEHRVVDAVSSGWDFDA